MLFDMFQCLQEKTKVTNERSNKNLKTMASMKVKAGIKSDIAVAKMGEQ